MEVHWSRVVVTEQNFSVEHNSSHQIAFRSKKLCNKHTFFSVEELMASV